MLIQVVCGGADAEFQVPKDSEIQHMILWKFIKAAAPYLRLSRNKAQYTLQGFVTVLQTQTR